MSEEIRSDAVSEVLERLQLQTAVIEHQPDAKVVIDEGGKIVMVNRQTELMFGYPRAEMLGQQVEMLIPNRLREEHLRHRADYGDEPRLRPMGLGLTLLGLRKNGREFPIEIMLAPIVIPSGSYTIAVIRSKKK